MTLEELTPEQRKVLTQGYQDFRADTVAEIARTKNPDEAAQVGYNLGYGKGFMDGMNLGYAEGVRNEKKGRA
jgi:hypothetical protein